MMMVAPFFSSGVFPLRLKAMLSFLKTLVVFLFSLQQRNNSWHHGLYIYLYCRKWSLYFHWISVSIIFSAFQLSDNIMQLNGFGIHEFMISGSVSVPLLAR
jgi:flagellar biosynthesis protein FliR